MPENKKKQISKDKVRANRQNALVSTGPRTPTGKQVSSKNALKHGILSNAVIIEEGEGKEPAEVFSNIQNAVLDYYQPVGPIESLLADRIVGCFWRLRRVTAFETGSIRMHLDSITEKRKLERESEYSAVRVTTDHKGMDNASRLFMNSTVAGLKLIIDNLDSAKQRITENKTLDKEIANEIIQMCASFHDGFPRTAVELALVLEEGDINRIIMRGKPARQYLIDKGLIDKRTKNPKKILAAFVREIFNICIKEMKKRLKQAEQRDALADQSARLAAHLPAQADIDKICRYEAHLERQISKAIDQLERLQRNRLGEQAPPRLNLDVNVENVNITEAKNAKRSQRVTGMS